MVPARLKSTRFPKKMLSLLQGKPMLQWIWDKATQMPFFDEVVFAVDSEEVALWVESFGGRYYFTDPACASGTERAIELMQKGLIQGDIWVNWQGDEPFVNLAMIETLLQSCMHEDADVWTLKKKIERPEEISSPHVVKVVCDVGGRALYFSRSPIPCYREARGDDHSSFKHVGMYAYTAAALEKIATLSPCVLEQAESLEQLRFLYHGLRVMVHETPYETLGIDLAEHLHLAETISVYT